MKYLKYIGKRILVSVILVFAASSLVFFLMHFALGDPVTLILGDMMTPETVHGLKQRLGLLDPLYIQYAKFVFRLVQGNLGVSWYTFDPVADEVMTVLPNTLLLTLAAAIVALILGVPTGILSACRRNTRMDITARSLVLIGISLPGFVIALILIIVFSVYLEWFPTSGFGEFKHVVLPGVSLGVFTAAIMARITRSSMLDVILQDYIVSARAKGLSEKAVIFKHALRNALIPLITFFGLQFGVLMGGSVVTESVFAWPGVGRIIVESIKTRDIPMVQGAIVIYLLVFILINLIVDIVYVFVDPRIKLLDEKD